MDLWNTTLFFYKVYGFDWSRWRIFVRSVFVFIISVYYFCCWYRSNNPINIGERAGSGVSNIFNVWADEGLEESAIEERFDPDRMVLSLSFQKSGDKKRW